MPSQGDLILITTHYTDLSASKKRPVIVVSQDSYNQSAQDLVVVAMTSTSTINPWTFTITQADLVAGTLNRPGQVRCDKVYTLAQSLVVKTFGKVGRPVLLKIQSLVCKLLEPPQGP